MVYSMTGVGFGEAERNGTTLSVELKSVNNRYLEISCRMPSLFSQYERDVRNIIRKQIQRGKLYATFSIQGNNENVLGLRVDGQIARAVHGLLLELRETSGVRDEIRLEHLLHFSEVFESLKESEAAEVLWEGMVDALNAALVDLKRMRQQEGEELLKDIVTRIHALRERVDAVAGIAEGNAHEAYERMVERVKGLKKNGDIDTDRLYAELALMADKLDVTEECVRLRSHYELFMTILEGKEVVGKKLNFLLQEMNRETNTISNKASNAEISHLVVEMKDEIEKLREQVQNLE